VRFVEELNDVVEFAGRVAALGLRSPLRHHVAQVDEVTDRRAQALVVDALVVAAAAVRLVKNAAASRISSGPTKRRSTGSSRLKNSTVPMPPKMSDGQRIAMVSFMRASPLPECRMPATRTASFNSPGWRLLSGRIFSINSRTRACSSAPAVASTSDGVPRIVDLHCGTQRPKTVTE
jgi:hypothetical protein